MCKSRAKTQRNLIDDNNPFERMQRLDCAQLACKIVRIEARSVGARWSELVAALFVFVVPRRVVGA